MKVSIHPTTEAANAAAAECFATWLDEPSTRNVMLATGNTPLDLYQRVARRELDLSRLKIFAMDEYGGVPADHPRNCGNILERHAVDAWGIPRAQFFRVNPSLADAVTTLKTHEELIEEAGGIDVIVLGLGQNGHLGFNEPGSTSDSPARVVALELSSIEANLAWFNGEFAPDQGVTTGLQIILGAKRVLLMAYGRHKSDAVASMLDGPINPSCPASFLQAHPRACIFLDRAAAGPTRQDTRA